MRPEDRNDHELGGNRGDGSAAPASDDTERGPATGGEPDWSPAERALLDSALDFFGAAEAVIDYAGPDRPHLRYDVDGLHGVRSAMAALEARIHVAHETGVTPERIANITRLEREIVELIIARHGAQAADSGSAREPASEPQAAPSQSEPA